MLAKKEYKIDQRLNDFFVAHIRSCYFCLDDGEDCVGDNCPKFDDLSYLIESIRYEKRKNDCDVDSKDIQKR